MGVLQIGIGFYTGSTLQLWKRASVPLRVPFKHSQGRRILGYTIVIL